MNAYVDSSVILRRVLGQPRVLRAWRDMANAYTSRLATLEVFRSLDRLRLVQTLTDAQLATARERAELVFGSMTLISVNDALIAQASMPMPTVLASLDALHLTTAILLRAQLNAKLAFATHDVQLATGARASGFSVLGC